MVRPKKCRLVDALPDVTYFKPAGIPLMFLSEVKLSIEEVEALRLKYLENLEQVEGAKRMGVSRPTFQRVMASAHKKVADAILNGKAIRIEGGNYHLSSIIRHCRQGHSWAGQDNSRCPECEEANDAHLSNASQLPESMETKP